MNILFTLLIFVALTAVFALLGLNVWVWPKAAIDRVTASAADPQAQHIAHPSLAFRDLLKKLGSLIAASSWDSSSKFLATIASVAIGFFAPNEYVRAVAARRQKQLRRGLPNALD